MDRAAADMVGLLKQGEKLEAEGDLLRANVRFSTLDEQLFVHPAFRTEASDTVLFGPAAYRFARALHHSMADIKAPASIHQKWSGWIACALSRLDARLDLSRAERPSLNGIVLLR
jgi:hypothetical protein